MLKMMKFDRKYAKINGMTVVYARYDNIMQIMLQDNMQLLSRGFPCQGTGKENLWCPE